MIFKTPGSDDLDFGDVVSEIYFWKNLEAREKAQLVSVE
jgi:hypothetical protein